jgi:hypothetical protein
MRYNLGGGIVIKTENAAKPSIQASQVLSAYIKRLDPVGASFDYGCGKLRYVDSILECTDFLTVVDSETQIARTQAIYGNLTSVREIAKTSNRMAVANVVEFSSQRGKFDRGFCINVLSVIPLYSVRRNVLSLIRQSLRPGGTCLFVVQYRNSDFGRMSRLPNARPWRDGFLIDSLRGFSFYGLISPRRLTALVLGCGFEVVDQYLDDGRVFLMARSPRMPQRELEVISELNFTVRPNKSGSNILKMISYNPIETSPATDAVLPCFADEGQEFLASTVSG